jgi:hypothetical protein
MKKKSDKGHLIQRPGSAGLKRRNNGRNGVYPALPKSPKTTVKLSEKCGHLVVSIVFNDVL